MLSRTAASLYWMSRYIERAENLARILEVGYRMSRLPDWESGGYRNEWASSINAAGCETEFLERHEEATAESVINFIALDADNPSSIYSCLQTARTNGRSVRTALTTEVWETLNTTWLEIEGRRSAMLKKGDIRGFIEWVRERSLLFRGAVLGTMLREEAFYFTNLGTFVERGDNTARILDVKYHVLLPSQEAVGGGVDYYQWSAVLRSVSALGSYHYIYRENPRPWNIAELMILRQEMPRSLIFCLAQAVNNLQDLAAQHGRALECHRVAGKMYSDLRYARIDDIFQSGLHEYLRAFIADNNQLGNEIARSYLFHH